MSKEKKIKKTDASFDVNAWLEKVDQEKVQADRERYSERIRNGADPLSCLIDEIFNAHTEGLSRRANAPELTTRLTWLFHRANDVKKAGHNWRFVTKEWIDFLAKIDHRVVVMDMAVAGMKERSSLSERDANILFDFLYEIRDELQDLSSCIESTATESISAR